jgi:hypothetical protein
MPAVKPCYHHNMSCVYCGGDIYEWRPHWVDEDGNTHTYDEEGPDPYYQCADCHERADEWAELANHN